MFAKFKLSNIKLNSDRLYKIGKDLYDENKAATYSRLEDYITKKKIISAQKIEDDWFPQIDADIFLSHSHADEKKVITIAGWLNENFGVNAFVDSCVWAYCDDLINLMERKWNSEGNKDVSRQICSHVYMMLNTALHKMIDKTECLIFVETPKSVAYEDYLGESALNSPWIYSELLMGNLIQSKPLMHHRQNALMESIQHFSAVKIEYKICLDGYEDMGADELNEWMNEVNIKRKNRNINKAWTSYESMDVLYDLYDFKDKGYVKGSEPGKEFYIG